MGRDAFLIPLKDFSVAKDRLRGGSIDATQVARDLALGVLQELKSRNVLIVTESPNVIAFAADLGIACFQSTQQGLNAVVQDAYDTLIAEYDRLTVLHGDLKNPRGLRDFTSMKEVTIVTDRHGKGTNVLSLPTGLRFNFAYGGGSAQRHIRECAQLGLELEVITNSPWGHDVDVPEDLV